MRRILAVLAFLLVYGPNAQAEGSLDAFLQQVNVEAQTNLSAYAVKVSAQFGVPESEVHMVLSAVSDPADAFMVFQIGRFCGCKSDHVLSQYRVQKGKGWGAIAKDLGIKPGSSEFHALKSGDLHFTGIPDDNDREKGHGNGKGHGKGHGKP